MFTFTENLVESPEIVTSTSGKTVAKGRVICSDRYKDSATGEWIGRTVGTLGTRLVGNGQPRAWPA